MNDSIKNSASIIRAGLNYKLAEGTHIRMSFGQGYRFPTIAERYIRTSVGSFGVFDNPDLKPEHSWNLEAGIRQGYKIGDFPNAERLAKKVLSFPHHQHLTKNEIKFVSNKINKFYEKN